MALPVSTPSRGPSRGIRHQAHRDDRRSVEMPRSGPQTSSRPTCPSRSSAMSPDLPHPKARRWATPAPSSPARSSTAGGQARGPGGRRCEEVGKTIDRGAGPRLYYEQMHASRTLGVSGLMRLLALYATGQLGGQPLHVRGCGSTADLSGIPNSTSVTPSSAQRASLSGTGLTSRPRSAEFVSRRPPRMSCNLHRLVRCRRR